MSLSAPSERGVNGLVRVQCAAVATLATVLSRVRSQTTVHTLAAAASLTESRSALSRALNTFSLALALPPLSLVQLFDIAFPYGAHLLRPLRVVLALGAKQTARHLDLAQLRP